MICQFHHYIHKEAILRKSWEVGDLEFNGAPNKILPDLSRATLQCQALLRPLLELASGLNVTYRWGVHLSDTFRKNQQSFPLCVPESLPAILNWNVTLKRSQTG